MVSIKREERSIESGYRKYLIGEGGGTEGPGQFIMWWQFNEDEVRMDPVYDESPARTWDHPIYVPILWIVRDEEAEPYTGEGTYDVITSPLVVLLLDDARKYGIRNPESPVLHWKDRFAYLGTLYSVEQYNIWGHFPGSRLTVSLKGVEVKPDEATQDQPVFFTGSTDLGGPSR